MSTGAFNPYMTFGERKQVVEKFKRVLARLTYKRYWQLELMYDLADGTCNLCMTQLCIDIGSSRLHPHTTKLGMTVPVDLWAFTHIPEEHIARGFIREAILKFETHEMDEWLMLDGHPLVNPHPEICEECGRNAPLGMHESTCSRRGL